MSRASALSRRATLAPLRRAVRQVRADLRADPYLAPILALTVLLASFWIHHGLPNFATRDERWRVVDVVEPLGFAIRDGDLASVRDGVVYWRSYGATFYLYGVALLPSLLAIALFAGPETFVDLAVHPGFWDHWLSVPGWVWTALVLPARLVNAALAVGCVYLTYRLGTEVRDRATGRLAALLLALTWALLVLAHEAGEDVPALFAFLLTLLLAFRYVENGSRGTLYRASFVGGVAAGLKLTAGVGALVIAAALLLRERRAADHGSLARSVGGLVRRRWRVVLTGAALGTVALLASYPSVLVGAPSQLGGRILRGASSKGTTHGWLVAPTWWWVLRGYLHGFGLPLFAGVVAGVGAALRRLRSGTAGAGTALLLVGVGAGLAAVLPWAYIRTHHLLPTFPPLLVLLAMALSRLRERRPAVGRALVAALVLTSAVYAGVGVAGYATQPRDRAAAWLAADAGPNATLETYAADPQEAGIPHGLEVYHREDRVMTVDGERRRLGLAAWMEAMPRRCPDYIVLTYERGLLYLAPEDRSKRAADLSYPAMEAYVRTLLAEDTYPYAVVETFGPRPRFLDGKPPLPVWRDLLRVGIVPRTVQYGDPQDFGVEQYTVVLKRTGEC